MLKGQFFFFLFFFSENQIQIVRACGCSTLARIRITCRACWNTDDWAWVSNSVGLEWGPPNLHFLPFPGIADARDHTWELLMWGDALQRYVRGLLEMLCDVFCSLPLCQHTKLCITNEGQHIKHRVLLCNINKPFIIHSYLCFQTLRPLYM